MKHFIWILVFVLVGISTVFGGGRERYQAPRAWGRSKNYRTYDRRGYNYNHNYRRYDRDPISKDLRRISYGVGIASDIVGLYNEVRYGGRSNETVVVQQEQVVVQQQPPVIIQQPPVIWQAPPVIIRPLVIIIK